MRPKHTKKGAFLVWDMVARQRIEVNGYRVTKHFAVTTPLAELGRRFPTRWGVTHIPTGCAAANGVPDRRLAEIICMVMELGPTDWKKVTRKGNDFPKEAQREIAKSRHIRDWAARLETL